MSYIKPAFDKIFDLHYKLSKKTLETSDECFYSLNGSLCEFSVSFSVDEFVLSEQFYELLNREFKKHSITQEWSNFMKSYSYKDNKCYCRLRSTNKTEYCFIGSKKSLSKKKKVYFLIYFNY